MDYSSGSFTDFIVGSEEDTGGTYGSWPDVAPADFVPEPPPAAPGDYAEPEGSAEPGPGPGLWSSGPARSVRWRSVGRSTPRS